MILKPEQQLVEATGVEPAASWSQTKHSTKLSYASKVAGVYTRLPATWDCLPITTNKVLQSYTRCEMRWKLSIRLFSTQGLPTNPLPVLSTRLGCEIANSVYIPRFILNITQYAHFTILASLTLFVCQVIYLAQWLRRQESNLRPSSE